MRRALASGFLPALLLNLLYRIECLVPALVLLGLHLRLGWPLWPVWAALGLWLAVSLGVTLAVVWAADCSGQPAQPRQNRNPYSSAASPLPQNQWQPATVAELERWMKSERYSFAGYNIGDHFNPDPPDGCRGIGSDGSRLIWYRAEKGKARVLGAYDTEQALVAAIFPQIRDDREGRAHLVCRTQDRARAEAECARLRAAGVLYEFRDTDGGAASPGPLYQVFVYGRDIDRVQGLPGRSPKR